LGGHKERKKKRTKTNKRKKKKKLGWEEAGKILNRATKQGKCDSEGRRKLRSNQKGDRGGEDTKGKD